MGNGFDYRKRLEGHIHMDDIHELCYLTQLSVEEKEVLISLLHDEDIRVATNAAWCMTHFDRAQNGWLYSKRKELMELAMITGDSSLRRLTLTLLARLEFRETDARTDFLDFCLEHMMMVVEPYGIRALCMKLAFNICRLFPELLSELRHSLEIMEPDLLPPSLKSVRKHILRKLKAED